MLSHLLHPLVGIALGRLERARPAPYLARTQAFYAALGLPDSSARYLGVMDAFQNVVGTVTRWGFVSPDTLPTYTGLTGTALHEAIMMEKYKANFLNIQVWSDWRRTGYPMHTAVFENRNIPRRFHYSDDEFNVNPNTPVYADPLYERVGNDPN